MFVFSFIFPRVSCLCTKYGARISVCLAYLNIMTRSKEKRRFVFSFFTMTHRGCDRHLGGLWRKSGHVADSYESKPKCFKPTWGAALIQTDSFCVKYHFNLLIDPPTSYLVLFSLLPQLWLPSFPFFGQLTHQIGSHGDWKDDWHILSQWHSLPLEVNAKDMTSEPHRWRRTRSTDAGGAFQGPPPSKSGPR